MTAHDRLPPIPAEQMTAAQTRAQLMGEYLRYRSGLPPRLSEFVIILTAREWTQQYEWNVHYPIAIKAGVTADFQEIRRQGHLVVIRRVSPPASARWMRRAPAIARESRSDHSTAMTPSAARS